MLTQCRKITPAMRARASPPFYQAVPLATRQCCNHLADRLALGTSLDMVSDTVSHPSTPEICILESFFASRLTLLVRLGRAITPAEWSMSRYQVPKTAPLCAPRLRPIIQDAYNGKRELLLRRWQHKPPAAGVKPSSSAEPGNGSESSSSTVGVIGYIFERSSAVRAVFCHVAMAKTYRKAIVSSENQILGRSKPNTDHWHARVGTQPIGTFSTSLAGFSQPQLPIL
ncbi:hypothetical protein PMIN02_012197 [Paraphaeosphaeria minitans]|uniref:Uncharacterized protein n=1 Tax=Paraphaeosphaeria minitans TaxID=565426 RepID=A0A9P6KLS9_9PLEO|nr:hypothetical protein PMIN01_10919 [Paraphaeosphaeria minitans]